MEEIYWTTKDGTKMNVDDMDDNHVRNAFKMVLRNIKALQEKRDADLIVAQGQKHEQILSTFIQGEEPLDFMDAYDCWFDPNWD